MSRRAAALTQAEVRRICAGARQEGSPFVLIKTLTGVVYSIVLDKEARIDDYMKLFPREEVYDENFTL